MHHLGKWDYKCINIVLPNDNTDVDTVQVRKTFVDAQHKKWQNSGVAHQLKKLTTKWNTPS